MKQLKTFSSILILSSGSISSTLYLGDWGTIECRGLRATPWNTTWQRMFWFLNQIVESTDTFGTRFISDTSILKETNLDHSLFLNKSGRCPGCFLAHKTPVECLYVVLDLQSYPLWKNVFSGEFPPSPWKYVRMCLCVPQMTIMATVNGQTMVGHRFLCKVLYIRTPTKCKVLHTLTTTKSKVYATVSSETTCVLNTKTIQSTVSHAKCFLFLPPLPGGPKPTQCNILLATALTKINGG